MPHPVFCYGTLLLPALAAAVTGRQLASWAAHLPGYRRAALRGRDYPGLWRVPAARTEGRLYQLRHRRELRRLDDYEGPEYRRRRLWVQGPAGPCHAWAYLPGSGRRADSGRDWSLTLFRRRALRRYLRHIAVRHGRAVVGEGRPGA